MSSVPSASQCTSLLAYVLLQRTQPYCFLNNYLMNYSVLKCNRAVSANVFATFQHITSVDNKYTQESTVFNPLRGKRPGAGGGASEETKK